MIYFKNVYYSYINKKGEFYAHLLFLYIEKGCQTKYNIEVKTENIIIKFADKEAIIFYSDSYRLCR